MPQGRDTYVFANKLRSSTLEIRRTWCYNRMRAVTWNTGCIASMNATVALEKHFAAYFHIAKWIHRLKTVKCTRQPCVIMVHWSVEVHFAGTTRDPIMTVETQTSKQCLLPYLLCRMLAEIIAHLTHCFFDRSARATRKHNFMFHRHSYISSCVMWLHHVVLTLNS